MALALLRRRWLALAGAAPSTAPTALLAFAASTRQQRPQQRPQQYRHHFSSSTSSSAAAPAPPSDAPGTPGCPRQRQSRFLGVHFNGRRWVAELRTKGKRVLWRSFPHDQETVSTGQRIARRVDRRVDRSFYPPLNRSTNQSAHSINQEAALAVDAAIREHFGPQFLTNFHAETGAFLDPRRALEEPAASAASAAAAAGGQTRARASAVAAAGVVSLVSESVAKGKGKELYKAVARLRGRPALVGLFPSAKKVGSVQCYRIDLFIH